MEVLGRLEFSRDLHAFDSVYHQSCSVNFRTMKTIPQAFSPKSNKQSKADTRGRPSHLRESFLKIAEYLRENDNEQITILDLVDKMKEINNDEAYSVVHRKRRLIEHFGDDIVITDIQEKSDVVTFRETAKSILHKFYQYKKSNDPLSEKMEIISTAAMLIKSDIREIDPNKSVYPVAPDLASVQKNLEYDPVSLRLFFKQIFSEKDVDLKLASIGQSVMQAARPRINICPLQIGLGVQLHHHFSSRFLIDTLYNLGFCSSYNEVQTFESSAAFMQGTDVTGYEADNSLQFVVDNVDHSLKTLDGLNTFHGMGIIAGMTPGNNSVRQLPRLAVTAKDLVSKGRIEIKYYKKPLTTTSVKFREVKDLKVIDKTWKLDFLLKVAWPMKSPIPLWSGQMQMLQRGEYPGKSSFTFFHMIDLDPADLTCIYSTLHFISRCAVRYNTTPVITFDQPLYWKAFEILNAELERTDLKNIVLKLGGFHTIMSFLGSIGHLMADTGLQGVLETVYAENAVTYIDSH